MTQKALPESVYKLFARTGHDVRGPAGVVAGALDELELALGGETTARNAVYFTMARRGVRRLLRLADRYTAASELARQLDAVEQETGAGRLTLSAAARLKERLADRAAWLADARTREHLLGRVRKCGERLG